MRGHVASHVGETIWRLFSFLLHNYSFFSVKSVIKCSCFTDGPLLSNNIIPFTPFRVIISLLDKQEEFQTSVANYE